MVARDRIELSTLRFSVHETENSEQYLSEVYGQVAAIPRKPIKSPCEAFDWVDGRGAYKTTAPFAPRMLPRSGSRAVALNDIWYLLGILKPATRLERVTC